MLSSYCIYFTDWKKNQGGLKVTMHIWQEVSIEFFSQLYEINKVMTEFDDHEPLLQSFSWTTQLLTNIQGESEKNVTFWVIFSEKTSLEFEEVSNGKLL